MSLGSTQPLTEMSTRILPGGKRVIFTFYFCYFLKFWFILRSEPGTNDSLKWTVNTYWLDIIFTVLRNSQRKTSQFQHEACRQLAATEGAKRISFVAGNTWVTLLLLYFSVGRGMQWTIPLLTWRGMKKASSLPAFRLLLYTQTLMVGYEDVLYIELGYVKVEMN
jgi:hypothetical protein